MDEKNKIQQLKTMLPQIEKFYKGPKIFYEQYELILHLAAKIDPSRSAGEIVRRATGIEVFNLWQLTRPEGYKVIQSLQEELEWMV